MIARQAGKEGHLGRKPSVHPASIVCSCLVGMVNLFSANGWQVTLLLLVHELRILAMELWYATFLAYGVALIDTSPSTGSDLIHFFGVGGDGSYRLPFGTGAVPLHVT